MISQNEVNKLLKSKYSKVKGNIIIFESAYVDDEIGGKYRINVFDDVLTVDVIHPLVEKTYHRVSSQTFQSIDDIENAIDIDIKKDSHIKID